MFSEKTSKILIMFGIGLFLIGIVLFFWQNLRFDISQQIDSNKFSQFGDFVGGIIGSLLAFAGVILFYVALTEQREDIRINRDVLKTQVNALEQQIKEFELQREELELTREVFVDQSKTLKLQQFESTFFNSMTLLNNIIGNISYTVNNTPTYQRPGDEPAFPQPDRSKTYLGRDCFDFFYKDLKSEYTKLIADYSLKNIKQVYVPNSDFNIPKEVKNEFALAAWDNFFDYTHSDLGHYFRTIYNIVKFINDKKPENPKYYTNLLRSQFSTYEHLLLFYNCISEFGNEKFKPLIIEYSMLDNLASSELLDNEHREFYPEKAYE
ncbi:Putative phage abortive infection protein [Williamwhitmania taraxaci]|uniref:Putative phage abortive infection protein n=2 Tax=Williamwhitmania taraxaci TaxID=1640674 RepID=A0A1G6SU01_9BACT|nr:Putative phage abortive infection protein [Williamwhitmania taraxaci]